MRYVGLQVAEQFRQEVLCKNPLLRIEPVTQSHGETVDVLLAHAESVDGPCHATAIALKHKQVVPVPMRQACQGKRAVLPQPIEQRFGRWDDDPELLAFHRDVDVARLGKGVRPREAFPIADLQIDFMGLDGQECRGLFHQVQGLLDRELLCSAAQWLKKCTAGLASHIRMQNAVNQRIEMWIGLQSAPDADPKEMHQRVYAGGIFSL